MGTCCVSEISNEIAKLMETQLGHASLQHPQTVGVVERSNSDLERSLKLNTNEVKRLD